MLGKALGRMPCRAVRGGVGRRKKRGVIQAGWADEGRRVSLWNPAVLLFFAGVAAGQNAGQIGGFLASAGCSGCAEKRINNIGVLYAENERRGARFGVLS